MAETDRERKHAKSRDPLPGLSGQIYSKNFRNRRKVSSLGGVGVGVQGTQEGAWRGQEGGGAPGGLLGPLEFLSGSTRAWNFPNFAKTLKSKLLLTFVMFPYRNTYLFLFCSCRSMKLGCNMLFVSLCIYHLQVHIDWITYHMMFESLSIHNLRFGAFKIIDLDCTRPIYFFDKKRSFPSRKYFTWRKPETGSKQQNFITNIKFTFQNSFIMPLIYLFLEHFSALVSFTPPLI